MHVRREPRTTADQAASSSGPAPPATSARHFEPVEHTSPIRVRLQSPQAPHPRVRQGTVVEVHGILRRHDDTDAERAGGPPTDGSFASQLDYICGSKLTWSSRSWCLPAVDNDDNAFEVLQELPTDRRPERIHTKVAQALAIV